MTGDTTPNDRETVLDWLADWLNHDEGLWPDGAEVLRDIVERPDEHNAELKMLVEYDNTHKEIAEALERADPQDWGYPAEDWGGVHRVRELRQAGFSHMQAITQMWKEKGLTHGEVEAKTGIPKGTVDVHSRRLQRKVREAKELLQAVEK